LRTCTVEGSSISVVDSKVVGSASFSNRSGGLVVDGLSATGSLSVQSKQGSVVMQRLRSTDVTLKLTSVAQSPDPTGVPGAALQMHLIDAVISGGLSVTTGQASEDLLLDHVRVQGRTTVRTGGGDDAFLVIDSAFAELASFDGGGGNDQLVLTNNQFVSPPAVSNFELVTQ